jgi:hypothetical protein
MRKFLHALYSIRKFTSAFENRTPGSRKFAHVLNKPIGSCYLKYAGTRGRFYYYRHKVLYLYLNQSESGDSLKDSANTQIMR